jgi:DNA-binding PadR family transcriptional regulator
MLLGVAGVISPCLGNDLDDILRSHSYFEPILHFLQEKGLLEKGEPEKIVG